jgi:serine/threonine protein kinase/Tol biopolymer transport system component
MTLTAGSRLGPYEIVSPLGAGGMGEVYRAKDTRLGREVAVKVLPASLSQDADRLRRFEQEARAASALNHPNIVTLHDVGQHESAPYVVTELLEGETLRARLATGALSPRKATEYAIQIAQGLAAAHEKAIVHRDLKPENLFVTEDGRVKILDFGLAKLIQPESSVAQQTSIPTAAQGTEPGVVLGTVGYMSPEQVKGQPADHRSDIFSFGAILYEMLSGRRAFRGDSAVETMSAILKEEPPDLSETNRNLSPGLDRLVRHCLEKAPAQRFQSARDLAYDLESLSTQSAPREIAAQTSIRRRSLRPLAIAAALAATALAGWLLARGTAAPPGSPKYRALTFQRGIIASARFAPDGSTIVYSAAWNGEPRRVFSTRAGSSESRDLALPDGDLLAVSSSGELALRLAKQGYGSPGTLATVPLEGGTPRQLQEGVTLADWSPDGKTLAIVRSEGTGGRETLEYPVGKNLYETANSLTAIRFSSRGDSIAVLEENTEGFSEVDLVDLSGKKRTLTSGWPFSHSVAWGPDEREVWFSAASRSGANEGEIYAVSLSGRVRLVRREAQLLIISDVARDGRALLVGATSANGMLGVLAADQAPKDLTWLDISEVDAISADGTMLLFDEWGRAGGANGAFYVRKSDGSGTVRLGEGSGLALSEDGRWVFATTPEGLVLVPTGPGTTRSLGGKGLQVSFWGGCLDGENAAYFKANPPGQDARLYRISLQGGAPAAISGPVGVGPIALSPDRKLIASNGLDGPISLYPVDGGASYPLPGSRNDESPVRFAPDGRSLYVYERGRVPARVYRIEIDGGRREVWKELAPADLGGVYRIPRVVMSADARFYAYSFDRALGTLFLAEGLR